AARAHAALQAGCDMVLVCNDRPGAVQVAEALERHQDPVAHTRMARMHGKHPVALEALHAEPRWEQAVAAVQGYEEEPELNLEA
ncbi:MAG TPA: beta-N-acetylhexosaminidase, partial [Gammaproteobacteria bacterium]|nr:beta-N-acetylhexosaminidase [Gammaproteobacteria bacterium]